MSSADEEETSEVDVDLNGVAFDEVSGLVQSSRDIAPINGIVN